MNSRSRVSRLASSAPSQRIAGPSRVSSARSGPTANGISTTTVRKNNTPISAPPPTRSAILMSLRINAARGVMRGVSTSCAWSDGLAARTDYSLPPCGGGSGRGVAIEKGFDESALSKRTSGCHSRANRTGTARGTPLPAPPPQGERERTIAMVPARRWSANDILSSPPVPDPQFFRLHPQWRMRCGDDQAAARQMIAHQGGEHALPGGVERVGRFVQQPDRPPHHKQSGDREPPPLSGRQIGRRKMRGMIEPDRCKARPGVEGLAAEKIAPER